MQQHQQQQQQLFASPVPKEKLYQLLNDICTTKVTNKYIMTPYVFDHGMVLNIIPLFMNDCKQYYYKSKQYYVSRDITYTRFITVIKQICKCHNIKFDVHKTYLNTEHVMNYFIYNDESEEK